MARRRRSFRAKARRIGARSARFVRRGTRTSRGQLIQVDAMLYGAVRGAVSNLVQKVVPIPVVGTIGDEVTMGLVNWFVAKKTKGMVRDVAVKGLAVENALIGAEAGKYVFNQFGNGSSSSGSSDPSLKLTVG